jgi:hypothetical protein
VGQLPTPTGNELLIWCGCAAFVMMFANQAFGLKAKLFGEKKATEITPQPLDVRMISDFVRQQECRERHNESVRAAAITEKTIEALRLERKADMRELHVEVNAVAGDVSGLMASSELQGQQLARMDAKLDRIVERRLAGV